MIGRLKIFLFSIGAIAAVSVQAADLVAVWDGNFSDLTQNGLTIDLRDNSVSEDTSIITITQDVGVDVTKDQGTFSGGYTVLIKYSDLDWALADKQVLMTTTTTEKEARAGVTINKVGKTCGIWDGNSWNSSGTYNVLTNVNTAGVLAYSHYSARSRNGYGTALHYLRGGVSTVILRADALGSGDDVAKYKGITIGGMKTNKDGFSSAKGMKICGIAVFEGILTAEEMAAYTWPSMTNSTYQTWGYAGARIFTAKPDFENFENPKYMAFDFRSGIEGPVYEANDTIAKWQSFAYSNAASFDSNAYQAPGNVLRLVEPGKAYSAAFAPLTFGGMIVESTATGCSLASSGGGTNRNTLWGDPTAGKETWFRFDTSFSVDRMGQSMLIGTVNIEINNEATVKLSGAGNTSILLSGASGKQAGANPSRALGGVLKMHGSGSITAGGSLDASSATLDFSNIGERAIPAEGKLPFINCPLVLSADSKLIFPDGISLPYSYKVAASISGTVPSFCLYPNGELIVGEISMDEGNGIVTIAPSGAKVLSGTNFDEAANWEGGLPNNEGDVIVNAESDIEISVSGIYSLNTLTIFGTGTVSFVGTGSIVAQKIKMIGGAKLVKAYDAPLQVSDPSSIYVGLGSVLRIVGPQVGDSEAVYSEASYINGSGSVETFGRVDLAKGNQMTGGITVKSGSLLSTSREFPSSTHYGNTGYGSYSKDVACANQSRVVVENGGCVDVNNIVNRDCGVALVVAGKGIRLSDGVYSGAVKYSGGTQIGTNKRQISYIELTDDAEIDCGAGWGLVHHDHGNARLMLNGHTLVVRGSSNAKFVAVKVNADVQSSGALVIDGSNGFGVEFSQASSNLGGINVVVKGSASADFGVAPSGMGSLTFKPSNSGITASNLQLPAGYIFKVDSSNIDPAGLPLNAELTLLTVPSTVELRPENIALGARYESIIDGNTVKVKVVRLENFLHYDYCAADSDGAAIDSGTKMQYDGENGSMALVNGRNGKAVHIHTGYTPYWDSYENSLSPFRSGEISVTTLAQIKETGVVLWGFGNGNQRMGLVVIDEKKIGLVVRQGQHTKTILEIEVEEALTKGWHFIALVANSNGSTLYIDDKSVSTDDTITFSIGQQGQLGSFYGGAIGGNKVGENGYYLDDWRVYDVALMESEIRALRGELNPKPFVIRIR